MRCARSGRWAWEADTRAKNALAKFSHLSTRLADKLDSFVWDDLGAQLPFRVF